MPPRSHHPVAVRRAAVHLLAIATFALLALPVGASAASDPTPRPSAGSTPGSYAPAFKRLQQRLLLQGAQARMARAKALARLSRRHAGPTRPGAGVRRPGDWNEAGGPQGRGVSSPAVRRTAPAQTTAPLVIDVPVNNRAEDALYTIVGQAEEKIAALDQNVLVAWNDGLGFAIGGDTQGYGYSVDGGLTYTDGGVPPRPDTWRWTSDPLVTVNEKTGDFWYCAMVSVNVTQNGIGVMKARFNGGTVVWSAPTLVRVGGNSSVAFDKPWLAADSLSGRLYLSYTVFGASADTIVFQRSSADGTTWDAPQVLSSDAEAGMVQGSRPVPGPNGEVYVTWYTIGPPVAPYTDLMEVRKSLDQGASFGTAATAVSLFANFGSGAPGFNRGVGVTYPSIAVDRSSGPHRGRVYLAWNESVDFYDDPLGTAGSVAETETNNTPASANAFTIGQRLTGAVSSSADLDFFKFTGTAGQTVIFYADSVGPSFSMALRLFCSDGSTRLALSAPGTGLGPFVCFSLPVSGTYYLRCGSWDYSTGGYGISTGLHTPTTAERARDHRDAFATWSDDGVTWSTPVRTSDSPAGFDDWLPEVAVGGDNPDPQVGFGRPYCIWYDWRESETICGGGSNIYLSRSDDAGGSWSPVGSLTAVQTDWTTAGSNLVPNQGDYLSLFANHANLYAAWADGRNGDPDIYSATIALPTTPVAIGAAEVTVTPGRVSLLWPTGGHTDLGATVERRTTTTDFAAIGEPTADGSGNLSFVDATVSPGGHYAYRLLWFENTVRQTTAEVWVDVPPALAFALYGARPNPASQGVFVSLALPDAAPATLELLDVTGRRLAVQQVVGAGEHPRVNVSGDLALAPGVYIVRLTQGDHSLTTRVTVVATTVH